MKTVKIKIHTEEENFENVMINLTGDLTFEKVDTDKSMIFSNKDGISLERIEELRSHNLMVFPWEYEIIITASQSRGKLPEDLKIEIMQDHFNYLTRDLSTQDLKDKIIIRGWEDGDIDYAHVIDLRNDEMVFSNLFREHPEKDEDGDILTNLSSEVAVKSFPYKTEITSAKLKFDWRLADEDEIKNFIDIKKYFYVGKILVREWKNGEIDYARVTDVSITHFKYDFKREIPKLNEWRSYLDRTEEPFLNGSSRLSKTWNLANEWETQTYNNVKTVKVVLPS